MNEEGKVSVNIRKYEFTVWESDKFIMHLLRKQAEEVIYIEKELAQKFIENEELFDSWLINLSDVNEQGVVIEALVNLNGTTSSTTLFKEPKIYSEYALLPIPYIAKAVKIIVLNEGSESEELAKESSNNIYDFSHEEYYVFFNPIKILKEFYAIIIVTSKGLEFIPLPEIKKYVEVVEQKRKTTKKLRKRRKKKKRKGKRSK
uniref:Uncharacterized protein n=1 Tax=Ignisphaera aggregans TaxID=334771 RepID=A0A7J2U423_9CREN